MGGLARALLTRCLDWAEDVFCQGSLTRLLAGGLSPSLLGFCKGCVSAFT